MTYTPPILPAHVSVHLEPVTGTPSEEEVVKVQDAIRSYQQFSNVPSMFDPRVNMELSQHLFDIHMARYTQRARQSPSPQLEPCQTPGPRVIKRTKDTVEESTMTTNNLGTGDNVVELAESGRVVPDIGVHDALETSNRLAEQANRLAGQASPLIEQSNQLAERPRQPANRLNGLSEQYAKIVERLTEHLERSDCLAEGLIKSTEAIGDTLTKMNRVLVWIQHAVVRNHKNNTTTAIDCLVNENGETPTISPLTIRSSLKCAPEINSGSIRYINPVISGDPQELRLPDEWLGRFVRFFGLAEGLFQDDESTDLLPGREDVARLRLHQYLSSCLG